MAWWTSKTEHAGAKHGKGYWGKKADAKRASNLARRVAGRRIATDRGDIDETNCHGDRPNKRIEPTGVRQPTLG